MNKLKSIAKRGKKSKITLESLNKWNLVLAGVHALQGLLIVFLSNNSTFSVSTNFLTINSLSSADGQTSLVPATRNLFDINAGYIVAAFFFMSALAHLLVATVYRTAYERNLKNNKNKARWVEYAFSASTMMVIIAMLAGVTDLSSLIMIFALTAFMNAMGLVMETWNQKSKKVNWLPFWIGSKAGIIPWIVVAIYFWGAAVYGDGQIPAFVYWIYGSLFLFFNCFAINMYLQYKRKGKWADYLYGERVYMILSLVAKSALAWQVFFGTLRP